MRRRSGISAEFRISVFAFVEGCKTSQRAAVDNLMYVNFAEPTSCTQAFCGMLFESYVKLGCCRIEVDTFLQSWCSISKKRGEV